MSGSRCDGADRELHRNRDCEPRPHSGLSPTPIRPHGTAPHREGHTPPHPIAVLGLRPAVLIPRALGATRGRARTRREESRGERTYTEAEKTHVIETRPLFH